MRIVLIHGFKGSSKRNFFPWLHAELRKQGHDVITPDLPSAHEPDPVEWTNHLIKEVGIVDDETIIVGHQIGGNTALRFLEAAEARSTPKAVILIATPWHIKDDKFTGFFMNELDYDVLMWKASRFTVVHAKDDNIIPFDHAEKYAKVLHANLVDEDGHGHYQNEQHEPILQAVLSAINEEIIYEPGLSLENVFEGLT